MLYVLFAALFVFARATTVPYCLNNTDVLQVTRYADPLVAQANVDFFGGTVCQTGEVCDEELCVPYTCSPDCLPGEICKNGGCRSVPSKLLEGHTTCSLRCGPRELCANGVCAPISRLRYKCKGDNCDVPTNNELCSILDNPDDLSSNPTCGSELSGTGVCTFGRLECVDGIPQCIGAILPSPERCDGLDNDCDGLTDEDFVLGQTCTVGIGLCQRNGETICNNAQDGTRCSVVPGAPSAETCDGFDNDCDGQIDEDFNVGQTCTIGLGACQSTGQFVCKTDTTGTECNAPVIPAGIETCNGIDDDCDGVVDNGFDIGTACVVGIGACTRSGQKVCSQDGTTTVCSVSPGAPVPEVCDDGIDNDCDGHIDAADPNCSEDECNDGQDNNNDGLFDCDDPDCNGAVRDCYFGPVGTVGVGICAAGTETCDGAGTWSGCTDVRPAPETCDGLDNDCDGVVDNVPPAILVGDEDNCGACGNVCPTNGLCIQSSCRDCPLVAWTYNAPSGGGSSTDADGSSNGDGTSTDGSGNPPDTAGPGAKFSVAEIEQFPAVVNSFSVAVSNAFLNAAPCGPNPGYKEVTFTYIIDSSISETFVLNICTPSLLNELKTYLENDFGSSTIQEVLGNTTVTIRCYADAGCLDVPCAADSCGNSGTTGVQTCLNFQPLCEDYIDNTANCGECGSPCGAGQTCTGVECVCNDPALTQCSGVCVDTTSDPQFCGGCNGLCPIDSGCCTSGCFPLGSCGSDAGECSTGTNQCVNGQVTCVGEVGPASEVCDGLDNDCDGVVDNNAPCPSGQTCQSGACIFQCPECIPTAEGEFCCPDENGCPVLTFSDANNCGSCGNVCQEGASCSVQSQTCVCPDCAQTSDNDICCSIDGACPVLTPQNENNCGSCGNVCAAGETCDTLQGVCVTESTCSISKDCDFPTECCGEFVDPGICRVAGSPFPCDQSFGLFDCGLGTCANPVCTDVTANDPQNCGGCGFVCGSGTCNNGFCTCTSTSECPSNYQCFAGTCLVPAGCLGIADGYPCSSGADIGECQSGVCVVSDSCTNGVLDGDETNVDCGGSCPACLSFPDGSACTSNDQCTSTFCGASGTCEPIGSCPAGLIAATLTFTGPTTKSFGFPVDAVSLVLERAVAGGGGSGASTLIPSNLVVTFSGGAGGGGQAAYNFPLPNSYAGGNFSVTLSGPSTGDGLDLVFTDVDNNVVILTLEGGKGGTDADENSLKPGTGGNGGGGALGGGQLSGTNTGEAGEDAGPVSSYIYNGAGGGGGASDLTFGGKGGNVLTPAGLATSPGGNSAIFLPGGGASAFGAGGFLTDSVNLIPPGFGGGASNNQGYPQPRKPGGRGLFVVTYCSACGDGVVGAGETCDDGNLIDGDGCNSACQIEADFVCEGSPSVCCPDPEIVCSGTCVNPLTSNTNCGACGTVCTSPDTCQSGTCLENIACGNGFVQTGETCDDGNSVNGDGCDSTCQVESGFSCTGEPSVCVPSGCVPIDVTYSTIGTFEHPLPSDAQDVYILEAVGGGGGGQRGSSTASEGCGGAAQSYFNVSLNNVAGETLRFVIPNGALTTATSRPDGGSLEVCKLPCTVGDTLLVALGGKSSLSSGGLATPTNGGDGAVGRDGGIFGGSLPQNGFATSPTQYEGGGGGAGGTSSRPAQRGGAGAVPPGYPPQISPIASNLYCSGGSSSYGRGGGFSGTTIIPAGFGGGGARGALFPAGFYDSSRGGRGKARLTYCSLCGNGFLETGEQCDDGNAINGDGCNSACQIEV